MNSEHFFEVFNQMSETADAIPRMRRFVLDLAVRGKLVEQDLKDEPASQLHKRICEEIERLIRIGELRKRRKKYTLDDLPYKVPNNWFWTSIRQVATDRGQLKPDRKFTYIDVKSIDKESGRIANSKVLESDQAPSRARKIVRKHDVIYSCVRPYLLNVAVISEDYDPDPIVSTAFAVLNGHGLVLPKYIWIVMRSTFMIESVEVFQRGQAYPAINDSDFATLPFPLPPLAEQHRIVEKVDELTKLCDELEASRSKRELTREKLTVSSLKRLTDSDGTAGDFRSHVGFVVDHFKAFTVNVDQIEQLRNTILNLAVQGKLVEQNLPDESESILLNCKTELEKTNQFIPTTSAPYQLPKNWTWTAFGNLHKLVRGVTYSKSDVSNVASDGFVPVLRANNIKATLSHDDPVFVKQERIRFHHLLRRGDYLIALSSGSKNLVGKAVYVPDDFNEAFGGFCGVIRLHSAKLVGFTGVYLRSSLYRESIAAGSRGIGINNLKQDKLANLPFPLPPIVEQHRIVEKVNVLMGLCSQIEIALVSKNKVRLHLLEVILSKSLNQ